MRRILFLLSAVFIMIPTVHGAFAQQTITMTIGQNAQSFHQELQGRRLQTIESRGLGDWWFRYHSMINAIFSSTSSKPNEANRPGLRLIENERNAFAVIYNRQRYILLGPVATGGIDEMLVFAHELGHHACGHTIGIRPKGNWDQELEADRFAGAAAHALALSRGEWTYNIYDIDLSSVIAAANNLYATMTASSTHPPSNLRVAAVRDGWFSGSPCFERRLLDVQPQADTRGTAPAAPMPKLIELTSTSQWAVGSKENCYEPRQLYSLNVSGNYVTWRDGIGKRYIESIDFDSSDEFRTTTLQSPTTPPGTHWRYVSISRDVIEVTPNKSRKFTIFRCP